MSSDGIGPLHGPDALSVRERVYRYLRQQIITGQYSGGTRLVEEQIAQELNVSRTPIREALQRLTSDGLVIRVRRGQLIVVDIDPQARAELHDLRIAFDEVAAKALTSQSDKLDTGSLFAALEPLSAACAAHGPTSPEYAMAHLEFHMAVNRIAFSPITSSFLEHQAFLYPTDDYVQQTGHEPISQHRILLEDLSSGDLQRALNAARRHALRGHGNNTLE